jgi:hypothetical protein
MLAAAVLLLAGCEDGGEDSGGDATAAALAGELFTQTAHSGSLTAVPGEDDVFTLTLDDPAPNVTVFTDRPVRSANTEPLKDFVESWDSRGFEEVPPNAALVLDEAPDDADTAVYTIADPKLDTSSGAVSYTATRIPSGTASLPPDEGAEHPEKFGDAHLFIDPSGGTTVALALQVQQNQGGRVQLAFDSPWTVVVGNGEQGIGYITAPNPGGGTIISQTVTMTSSGGVEFAVTGGSGPVTGTATVPSGAKLTVQVGDGPTTPVKNGRFSFGG